jgi:hypothetical protein
MIFHFLLVSYRGTGLYESKEEAVTREEVLGKLDQI